MPHEYEGYKFLTHKQAAHHRMSGSCKNGMVGVRSADAPDGDPLRGKCGTCTHWRIDDDTVGTVIDTGLWGSCAKVNTYPYDANGKPNWNVVPPLLFLDPSYPEDHSCDKYLHDPDAVRYITKE
jgi:hypothetical protein